MKKKPSTVDRPYQQSSTGRRSRPYQQSPTGRRSFQVGLYASDDEALDAIVEHLSIRFGPAFGKGDAARAAIQFYADHIRNTEGTR